jgi:hypothetical protein
MRSKSAFGERDAFGDLELKEFSLRPLRISAFSALNGCLNTEDAEIARLDYVATAQFIFLHTGCLLVFWTGISWTALVTCLGFYCLRIFAVSAGYHRYFAHRSYKTGRVFHLPP